MDWESIVIVIGYCLLTTAPIGLILLVVIL